MQGRREFSQLLQQPLPDNVLALLAAYKHVLDLTRDSSGATWIRHGPGVVSRRIRAPRMRLLLRYFVVDHIRRAVGALKRDLHAANALGGTSVSYQDEIERVESFEHSLPPIPGQRLMALLLLFAACFVSFLIAVSVPEFAIRQGHDGADHITSHTVADPLSKLTQGIVTFDRSALVDGVKSFGCSEPASDPSALDCSAERGLVTGIAGILLLSFALWLLVFLPLTSFALKRMLFNVEPARIRDLRSEFATDHDATSAGLYQLEEALFRQLNGPRLTPMSGAGETTALHRPREAPLDLWGRGLLIIIPLVLGSLGLAGLTVMFMRDLRLHEAGRYAVFYVVAALALAFVFLVPLARFVALIRTAKERKRLERAPAIALAPLRRRLLAHALDTLVVVALAAVVGTLLHSAVGTRDGAILADWLLVLPVAAALYLGACHARRDERRGQSLGKSMLGLRVVGRNGKPVSFARAFVREVVMKWGFLGLASLVAAGVPLLLNHIWPCFDHRKRALHDVLAHTQVERCEAEAVTALAAEPVPAGAT
jgi:uncharacterized RDD family membrane protein YckC